LPEVAEFLYRVKSLWVQLLFVVLSPSLSLSHTHTHTHEEGKDGGDNLRSTCTIKHKKYAHAIFISDSRLVVSFLWAPFVCMRTAHNSFHNH